jgi:hypothetical protein
VLPADRLADYLYDPLPSNHRAKSRRHVDHGFGLTASRPDSAQEGPTTPRDDVAAGAGQASDGGANTALA